MNIIRCLPHIFRIIRFPHLIRGSIIQGPHSFFFKNLAAHGKPPPLCIGFRVFQDHPRRVRSS
jgi:hypothetical protein